MPIFRLSRVFGVGRDTKVFFSLQGGLARGTELEDLEAHEEQAENLRNERQRRFNQRRKIRRQRAEIFRLKNELNAMSERVENAHSDSSAPQASGKPGMGALPDFVVIGAMRSGTSQFYRLLTQHPNVERSALKEVHYFDRNFERGTEWYRQCFPPPKWEDGRRSITGEATPSYMLDPLAPERMAQVVPEARLIALLRNPVDRAYSHHNLLTRRGTETRSFEEAIDEEQSWLLDKEDEPSEHQRHSSVSDGRPHNLLAKGIYVDQLLRWSKFFDEEQMLVLKSEDFYGRTTDTLKLVQDFLGLPYRKLDLEPYSARYRYEPMDPATRRWLEAFFEPHNRRLYEYLGVDFGW